MKNNENYNYGGGAVPIHKQTFFEKRYADLPRSLRKGKTTFLLSMLVLPLLGFFVFYFGVNFTGILLAFQQPTGIVNGVETFEWSLVQFTRVWEALASGGGSLAISVKNTFLYFALDMAIMLPLTFLIAYYFSKKLRIAGFLRILLFLPSMMSSVAVVSMFKNAIAFNGPIAMIAGEGYKNPLSSPATATPTIMFYQFFFGLSANVLLFQGALNRIPKEVLESAKLDGATELKEIRYMVLPMMMSTFSTIVILHVTGLFNASGPILVMTGGANNTSTISFWIYLKTVEEANYNMPAALGLCLTVISLPIVMLVRKLLMPKEDIEY